MTTNRKHNDVYLENPALMQGFHHRVFMHQGFFYELWPCFKAWMESFRRNCKTSYFLERNNAMLYYIIMHENLNSA